MNYCPSCGHALKAGARFCTGCGRDVSAAPAQSAAPTQAVPWQQNLPGPFATIPVELLVVCALMALAGALTLWPVIRVLPDTFRLLGDGEFARDFGLLFLTVWVVLGLFGVACLLLAWRLAHADRVARGLSYVLLGGLGASILIGDVHDTQLILVMLACFASMAVLGLAPRVKEYFTGAHARQYDSPTSVVTARTLIAVWASIMTLVGAMFVPLSGIGQKFVVVGVFFLVLGVGGFVVNKRLAAADPLARIIVSAGALVYAILLLVVGRRDPGLILPLSLSVGIIYFLWGPAEAKEYFAAGSVARPLPAWLQPATYATAQTAPAVPQRGSQSSVPTVSASASHASEPAEDKACRQPSCGAHNVPTEDNFCQRCGVATQPASA